MRTCLKVRIEKYDPVGNKSSLPFLLKDTSICRGAGQTDRPEKCTESCFIQIGVKVRGSGKMKGSRKEGNWSDSLRKTANKTKEDIKRRRME